MTKQTESRSKEGLPMLPSWFPGPLAFLAWAALALALIKPMLPLNDQATGRHLTMGKVILAHKGIPQHDTLNYLFPHQDYLNFEWLFDLGTRILFEIFGLGTLVFLTFVLFALTLCIMQRYLLENGVSLPVALFGILLLLGANFVHLLTRPVIVTYFFLALVILLWTRVLLQKKGRSPWWLPFVFFLWANIHPGFSSGLLFMGLALIGAMVDGRRESLHHFKFPCLLLALCAFVTLLNPYGWKLHALILHQVLNSKSLGQVQEFLPPDFLHPNGAVFALLVVLISVLVLGFRPQQKWCLREVMPAVVLLFFAWKAQRHILLFLPVALLPFCKMWDTWLLSFLGNSWKDRRDRYTALALHAAKEKTWVILGILIIGFLYLLAPSSTLRIGAHSFTPNAEDFVRTHLDLFRRPLTSSVQAGNLLFYFHPQLKVSFDDRVDFYQDDISFSYIKAIQAEEGWRDYMARYAFDSALLYPTDPLSQTLRHEPAWKEIYSDAGLCVFQRKQEPSL